MTTKEDDMAKVNGTKVNGQRLLPPEEAYRQYGYKPIEVRDGMAVVARYRSRNKFGSKTEDGMAEHLVAINPATGRPYPSTEEVLHRDPLWPVGTERSKANLKDGDNGYPAMAV